ncbi:MAG: F0F1 ATP synthase subunit gamma [Proteobacteria bacterium]|nr:F0F1 ATP synthase subunit gamma [Pseudomonadota bacterium]
MPSLKDLRIRINSVKSTRKITSAMKMVAASKLRRAQVAAEEARPFAERMERMLAALMASLPTLDGAPPLLAGTGKDETHLLVVVTGDRGLCGGFNANAVREARRRARDLLTRRKTVKILCIGRKARDLLRRDFADKIVASHIGIGGRGVQYAEAERIAGEITDRFAAGEFDVCTVIYNRFKSAISQIVTSQQMIPAPVPAVAEEEPAGAIKASYIMEPSEEEILAELLPRNMAVQVFRYLLESNASEQGARMTAMDNASRNAADMIDELTMTYNRTRQAYITKELIEIISGAEAL